ncbi:hypothetical protein EW026_g8096 [Hermanssonia centrifuga]|uniref:CHAT domain-containing protein n=1 Tax=Hermanssonia centrifuga TaxID=98765 RepID=A0A4S4K5L0_9APHY|nr:hypothetical protein EW026_g8096 [Hermanssonia centrifuga]
MDDSYYVVYKGAIQTFHHIARLHETFKPYGTLVLGTMFCDSDNHVAPSLDTAEGFSQRRETLASIYHCMSMAQGLFRNEQLVMAVEPPDICECSLHLALVFSQIALQKTEASESDNRDDLRNPQIQLLSERAKLPGFENDLNQVVGMCKGMLTPSFEGARSVYLQQRYVESLLTRFDFFHDTADLDESIFLLQQFADIPDYQLRDSRVMLCDAICKRFSSCGGVDNLTIAISIIQHFLIAPIWDMEWHNSDDTRLNKGRAFLAAIFRRLPVTQMDQQHGIALLEVYRGMLRLPYRMMKVGLDLHLGLPILVLARGLALEAFEHALIFSSPECAVEMLEKCRDVFWTQTLRLRSSFDGLPPPLAEKLRLVASKLESYVHMMYSTNWEGDNFRWQQELDVLRKTQAEFHSLAADARQLEGYEHFMSDPNLPFSSLAMAAQKGPVVILAAREMSESTDAIIIRSPTSGAEHIILHDMSLTRLSSISLRLQDLNTRSRNGDASHDNTDEISRAGRPAVRAGGEQLFATLWREVVRPVINALGYQKSDGRDRPRLWWCPTGQFMSVPLHAAGDYGGDGDCCSDYVVSSYTRSLQALSNARQGLESVLTSNPTKAMLVAETNAPNLTPLPNVAKEITAIKSVIPSHAIISLGGESEADHGTRVQDVVEALPQASIVHLACHGTQRDAKSSAIHYASEALESGFCLRDGTLKILHFLRLGMPRAFFAFLSACESAKGDDTQPDESVHMAAAMMFCGFRSVVATMWTMDDLDGPEVAKAIYTELFKGGPFNPDDVPYALDAVVRGMRARKLPPSRWATYVHMGV